MTAKFSVRTLGNSQCTNATNQILTEALPSAGALLLQIYEEVFVTDHQLNPISFPPENSILTMRTAYTLYKSSGISNSTLSNDSHIMRREQMSLIYLCNEKVGTFPVVIVSCEVEGGVSIDGDLPTDQLR